jgi:plasmid stability protein
MTALTIRKLEDSLKARLRLRAAARNRSMEEEVRHILRAALAETVPAAPDLGARIRARFADLGGVELALAQREPIRPPPLLVEVPARKRSRTTRAASGKK